MAALESHVMHLTIARDFDFEPIRKRVDALGADAVQATGIFICALAEFAAGVEIREDELDGGNLKFRMDVDRDAATVIADRHRAIDVNRHIDTIAKPGEMFVDGVVENFEDAVMQSAFVRIANVHSGAFPNGLQTLQLINF